MKEETKLKLKSSQKRKNNVLIISFIFMAIFLIIISPNSNVYAEDGASVKTWDETAKQAQDFVNNGKDGNLISMSDISSAVMPIAQALVAIASCILVIVTSIMGVKYAMAQTPDQQAKLKKQLIGLVVSCIVVFGAQGIWLIVLKFVAGLTG